MENNEEKEVGLYQSQDLQLEDENQDNFNELEDGVFPRDNPNLQAFSSSICSFM